MSGYRTHGYDPYFREQMGRPLRPYNWVQWIGISLVGAGFILILADYAARFGWIDDRFDPSGLATLALCVVGAILVSSRRAPPKTVGEEEHRRDARLTLVMFALGTAGLIGAIVLNSLGVL